MSLQITPNQLSQIAASNTDNNTYFKPFTPTVTYAESTLVHNPQYSALIDPSTSKEFTLLMSSNLSQGQITVLLFHTLAQALRNRVLARQLSIEQAKLALELAYRAADKQLSAAKHTYYAAIISGVFQMVGGLIDFIGQAAIIGRSEANANKIRKQGEALFPDPQPKNSTSTQTGEAGAQPKSNAVAKANAKALEAGFEEDVLAKLEKEEEAHGANDPPPDYDSLMADENNPQTIAQRKEYTRLNQQHTDRQQAQALALADNLDEEEKVDLSSNAREEEKVDLSADVARETANSTRNGRANSARATDTANARAQEGEVSQSQNEHDTVNNPEDDAPRLTKEQIKNQLKKDAWVRERINELAIQYDRRSRLLAAWDNIFQAIGKMGAADQQLMAGIDQADSTRLQAQSQFVHSKMQAELEFGSIEQQLLAGIFDALISMESSRHQSLGGIWS